MQDDLLGLLRREIEKAKPRGFDPDLHPKQPLEHGWLLPYLLLADDFTWKRWSYWHDVMQSRRVIGDTIPRIEWQSNPHARKMLENSLNSITRYGGWQGWGSWNFFSYFMDVVPGVQHRDTFGLPSRLLGRYPVRKPAWAAVGVLSDPHERGRDAGVDDRGW
jgi:hypothetical protein